VTVHLHLAKEGIGLYAFGELPRPSRPDYHHGKQTTKFEYGGSMATRTGISLWAPVDGSEPATDDGEWIRWNERDYRRCGWMIYFLQMCIMIAVLGANIYFEWTPNGFVAGLLGLMAAYVLTVLPVALFDWAVRKLGSTVRQKSAGDGFDPPS
jgi:hypothetical protein